MDGKKCSGGLNIDARLMLAPKSINSLNSEEAEAVLTYAFQFFSQLSKKL